jgi:hypothetical protein
MRLHIPTLAAALALALPGVGVFAQSLADVARKEDERRKTVAQPGKVYTNKDLGPSSGLPVPPVEPPSADVTPTPAPEEAPKVAEPVKDQAYWADRMKSLRGALDRDEVLAAALESRINALNADVINRDDPAQRATLETDRKKALAEVENLKKQIEADKKAIAGLEEEARRAGVPPGWLR